MIVLTVKSFHGAPVDGPAASFDETGGTIGRSDTSQLVLADQEREVSRLHARVLFRNGSYELRDEGSNPVLLNGQPLGNGRQAPLRAGDSLQIGGYVIAVSLGQRSTAVDPFADLFSAPGRQTSSEPVTLPGRPAPIAPPAVPAPPPRASAPASRSAIPEDWNPLVSDASARAPSTGADSEAHAPWTVPAEESSLDTLFGIESGGAPSDPWTRTPAATPAAQPNTAAARDPLAALSSNAPSVAAPASDHAPELATPWPARPLQAPNLPGAVLSWSLGDDTQRTQRIERPGPASKPAQPEVAAPAPRAAATQPAAQSQLVRALCEGLGVPALPWSELDEPRMRLLGVLLREATLGAVELLQARATLKREMRSDVTTIVARENNPLKFSPSVEAALQHLLGSQSPGFMAPGQAMRDAFDDLRAHQLGVLAGMRAALDGVLARFEPGVLESKLVRNSVLGDLLPSSRKARLWEAFQGLYSQLSQEAADDFDELFGAAFRRAYEAQMNELSKGR